MVERPGNPRVFRRGERARTGGVVWGQEATAPNAKMSETDLRWLISGILGDAGLADVPGSDASHRFETREENGAGDPGGDLPRAVRRGRRFGDAGPYERIDGIAHFTLDPDHPANREIVDLEGAPTATIGGLVRFNSDFTILRPITGGAGRLLVDVPNRGSKPANVFLNRAERALVPTVEIDPGDGFIFARGWTLAWVGWQWDVADHPALMGLRAPSAMANGRPIEGLARVEICFAERRPHGGLRDETLGPSGRTSPIRPRTSTIRTPR